MNASHGAPGGDTPGSPSTASLSRHRDSTDTKPDVLRLVNRDNMAGILAALVCKPGDAPKHHSAEQLSILCPWRHDRTHGSFVVGMRSGLWTDNAGSGGGLLALIGKARGITEAAAADLLRQHLGDRQPDPDAEQRRAREDADKARRRDAAEEACRAIWDAATPAPADHPYLLRKRVQPHHARLIEDGRLILPMGRDGELKSLQYIGPDGTKRFHANASTADTYSKIAGKDGPVYVVEGFATGATIAENTGCRVVIGYSAGQLGAATAHARTLADDVVIVADNDESGTGEKAARAAAAKYGVHWCMPPTVGQDANDYAAAGGDLLALLKSAKPVRQEQKPADGVVAIDADKIVQQPVRWLWPGWMAAGKLHMLAGSPGAGKSTMAFKLAAILSRGERLPDGTKTPRGRTLIWSAEDAADDTIVPRLDAAGADLSMIKIITGMCRDGKVKPFNPAVDLLELATYARQLGDVRLIIVDPIVSATTGDSHKAAEVRQSLQPLVDLLQEIDAAGIGITHLSKGSQDREPLERLLGSGAFGALPRLVWMAMRDKSGDRRMLIRVKSNIGKDGDGYHYDVEPATTDAGVHTNRVEFGEFVEGDARDLMEQCEAKGDPEKRETQQQAAAEWLRELLAGGPMASGEVKEAAEAAGHKWRTLERVKREISVVCRKAPVGWTWALPESSPPRPPRPPSTPDTEVGGVDKPAASEKSSPPLPTPEKRGGLGGFGGVDEDSDDWVDVEDFAS